MGSKSVDRGDGSGRLGECVNSRFQRFDELDIVSGHDEVRGVKFVVL